MTEGRVLIVFYSRTGTTRKVADAIHRELGGELVEVHTRHYPKGLRGFLRASLDAILGRAIQIRSKPTHAQSYDLVVVGTPVWNSSLSTPIRTYMAQSLPHAHHLAFFLTHGGSGARRVFGQMTDLTGRRPLATMAVTESEFQHRNYSDKMHGFVMELRELRELREHRGAPEVPKAA
jgi:flavodoxin